VRYAAALLALACSAGFAQTAEHQREIHRALIQRDQQSAEFAARLNGSANLEDLHERQLRDAQQPLSANPEVATQLLPYQRQRMAEERVLRLPPPIVRVPPSQAPLPLPGRPQPIVEPVAPHGFNG
jgi:hypothetical protein